ncbi:PEGA domain-containing protein [Candidatus Acetothermia bacterium]|nr:PEGA domain-containing protein [Candidatus Acetothermia bacterium]
MFSSSKSLRIVLTFLIFASALVYGVVAFGQNSATLVVDSDPNQSQVFVDGMSKGVTPVSVTVAAGNHQVIVRHSGCRDFIMVLFLQAGEKRTISARLSCTSNNNALLLLDSNPDGAQIFLDSQFRGNTPNVLNVAAGAHSLLLRRANCQDFTMSLTLNAGEQRRVQATLACTNVQPPGFPPMPPTQPQQSPVAQVAAQGQAILPSDPRFGALSAQFLASMNMDEQALAARLQAAYSASESHEGAQAQSTGGVNFSILPEAQSVDLNQVVLQQGQTMLLGTVSLSSNGTIGGVPLPAGNYGVAVMSSGAAGLMTDSTSSGTFGGFVIVIIGFTGHINFFIFFPTVTFFPFFFPFFSPIFVFQIFIQFIFPFPFFFPFFPFPFPGPGPVFACPPLPVVTPFTVTVGGPPDTILTTAAFTISETGFGGGGGALVTVQSYGPALSVQAMGNFSSRFVTVFPGGSVTFDVISTSFVMRVDGGGVTGCVNATRSPTTISGQASHN